jgi:predicted thioesterase
VVNALSICWPENNCRGYVKISFFLEAFDEKDKISKGTHDRLIIDAEKFNAAVTKKQIQ